MDKVVQRAVRAFHCIGLAWLFSCAMLVNAAELASLHRVSIEVANQSDSERIEAFKKGFQQVMHRVSIADALNSSTEYQQSIDKAEQFVSEYGYRRDDMTAQLVLDVLYSREAVKRLIAQARLPYWGADRPELLLWIAVEDQSGRYLVGSSDERPLAQSVQSITREAPLPVKLPVMDDIDQSMVTMVDIWGRFQAPIQQASVRYQSPVTATVGAAQLANGSWTSRWLLMLPQKNERWEATGSSYEQVVREGIAKISQAIAQLYAFTPKAAESNSDLIVRIVNVQSAQDYARVTRYLRDVSGVRQVFPHSYEQGELRLNVALLVDASDFAQTLALQNTLSAVPASPYASSANGNELIFELTK